MSRPRILVIEDNPADIELLRFALDRQGEEYDLEVLEDGEKALEFIKEHRAGLRSPDPCVILLDIHLPKYDGMQILGALKEQPQLTHINVIVISSVASPEHEKEIRALGAVYRVKPLNLRQFMALGADIFAICKEPALAA